MSGQLQCDMIENVTWYLYCRGWTMVCGQDGWYVLGVQINQSGTVENLHNVDQTYINFRMDMNSAKGVSSFQINLFLHILIDLKHEEARSHQCNEFFKGITF